jgi:hypothetical protein
MLNFFLENWQLKWHDSSFVHSLTFFSQPKLQTLNNGLKPAANYCSICVDIVEEVESSGCELVCDVRGCCYLCCDLLFSLLFSPHAHKHKHTIVFCVLVCVWQLENRTISQLFLSRRSRFQSTTSVTGCSIPCVRKSFNGSHVRVHSSDLDLFHLLLSRTRERERAGERESKDSHFAHRRWKSWTHLHANRIMWFRTVCLWSLHKLYDWTLFECSKQMSLTHCVSDHSKTENEFVLYRWKLQQTDTGLLSHMLLAHISQ